MNEEERNIAQQEIVLDSLAKLMASTGAMRAVMSALIASHPDPARLRDAWETRRLNWIDDEMAEPLIQLPAYRGVLISVLRDLSREIDRAAGVD